LNTPQDQLFTSHPLFWFECWSVAFRQTCRPAFGGHFSLICPKGRKGCIAQGGSAQAGSPDRRPSETSKQPTTGACICKKVNREAVRGANARQGPKVAQISQSNEGFTFLAYLVANLKWVGFFAFSLSLNLTSDKSNF